MIVLEASNRFTPPTRHPGAAERRGRQPRTPAVGGCTPLVLVPRPPEPTPAFDHLASATVLRGWLVQSLLLDAITSDGVGDDVAAADALERALDLAEPDHVLLPFLVHPVPALLERHVGMHAAHANLVAEIFGLLVGRQPAAHAPASDAVQEPLTETEARVLRYLPTDLSKPEIANELYVSVDTIKTHVKHLYAKLDAHSRREAVRRARELGLLPRSSRNR
jgi:LuxR family transcriptional regulator, maltose regulon positive regulatory protein